MIKIIICYFLVMLSVFSNSLDIKELKLEADNDGGYRITEYTGKSKEIKIPSKLNNKAVTEIKEAIYDTEKNTYFYAFTRKNLEKVEISDGVYLIGKGSFYKNNINKLILPKTLNYIDEDAFSYNQLNEINFPEFVYSIGDNAFSYNKIKEIVFPPNISYIGSKAFYRNNINYLAFPDTITLIEAEAFAENPITKVTIGKDVEITKNAINKGFEDAYEKNKKAAGTYRLENGNWIYEIENYVNLTNKTRSNQTFDTLNLGLYEEISEFDKEIVRFRTRSYMIKLDKMNDSSLRLALWEEQIDLGNKPDVLMYNGSYTGDYQKDIYTFFSGNDKYIIWVDQTGEGDPYGIKVYKGGKLFLNESFHVME